MLVNAVPTKLWLEGVDTTIQVKLLNLTGPTFADANGFGN